MKAWTYQEALAFLQDRTDWERRRLGVAERGAWTLARPAALLAALGHPERRYPAILIAGTKGKGSTAAFLDSILRAAGLRVGLYTQPHLHDYRERMRVNGSAIPQAALTDIVRRLAVVADDVERTTPERGQLTTYELGTALAFQHFADAGVDWAVVEVGLGGRLDATNVLTPAISAITALSLDHTAVLGDTLTAIATEKAGIIKPGVPAVSAAQVPEAQGRLTSIAAARGAPLTLGGRDFTWEGDHRACLVYGSGWGYAGLTLGLIGQHQVENAALAVAVIETLRATVGLEVATKAVRHGVASVRWPARLEVLADGRGRATIICDGAHNGASACRLAEAVQSWFPYQRLFLVLGSGSDKDLAGILAGLGRLAPATVWATASQDPRARPAADVAAHVRAAGMAAEEAPSVAEGVRCAWQRASPGDLVLATGSLFVAAEARAACGRTALDT